MALLIEIAELCARRFWRLLVVFGLVLATVAYALLSVSDSYEARTLLLFKLGREYIYVPEEAESGARAPDPGDLQLVVNAEMQILNGADLRAEVVDRLGAEALYPDLAAEPDPQAAARGALVDAISISLITGSYIVRLGVRHEDPETAALIANTLVEVYFDRRRDIFRTADVDVLRAQLRGAEEEVVAREAELAALLDGGDILSFETLRESAVEEQRRLSQQLLEVEATLASLTQRARLIERELQEVDPTVVDQRERNINPVVSDARATELALRAERSALEGQLGTGHPEVAAVAREIAALDELLAREPAEVETVQRTTVNPLWLQARQDRFDNDLERAEAEARRAFLLERIAGNRDRLSEASGRTGTVEVALGKLRREREQVADLYTRLREATTREELVSADQTNIRIIEAATPPATPLGPPKTVRLMIAILLAGIAALGYLLASYFLRQTVQSGAGAQERLGLPVLGEIERRTGRRRPSAAAA